ncbi:hypothetical protein GQ44DRAFT_753736 [Phaeosphaeriaceae sp. PMI808]|nr:hypothetical protein GQ44DRAFT_753736 [Phaeosphaeriaceae sp. PMI808]
MRVICVGAGASGLHLIYKLKQDFIDFTLDVFEKNEDIRGTWLENRYPGCRHNYVYSFEPNPTWSANYASSLEIFDYFSRFADKYGLRKHIHIRHEVVGATWNAAKACWIVSVERPDKSTLEQECDWFINGAGILNAWRWPAIPGIEKYKGKLLHSAAWDQTVDVKGKHVGLIGNGSSGIQTLPKMQKQAAHVTTFIRESTWVSPPPNMDYREYTEEECNEFVLCPEKLRNMRKAEEKSIGDVFAIIMDGSPAQMRAQAFIKQQMPGTDYLECLTKPNITTVYGSIKEITEKGCVTADSKEHPTDILICATGFDTTFRPRFPLIGKKDRVHAKFMNRWQKENIRSFDARREAVDDFMHQKGLFTQHTVWNGDCISFTLHYMETLATPRFDDFEVEFNRRRFAYLRNGFSQTERNPAIDRT